MKAITLWQPWASLAGYGIKGYETRSWGTLHRGPIAIHASAVPVSMSMIPTSLHNLCMEMLGSHPTRLPLGAMIGVADVIDVRKTNEWIADRLIHPTEIIMGDWRPGRFAWKLENARRFKKPIPMRGFQRIWNWEPPADMLHLF